MKVAVFAAGSQGDIQPCVALSMALGLAGYRVTLAAPANFDRLAQDHGVPFRPVGGDVQQLMASDTGRGFMESGSANPLQSIRAIRTMLAPVALRMAEEAFEACRDAEALICLGVFAAFGLAMAERLDIPLVLIEPTPLLPTRAFPAPSWPVQRDLGGAHNVVSGRAMLGVVWQWYRPFVRDFRRRLGLPALGGAGYHRTLRALARIGAYSPAVIAKPADWPTNVHVTGYCFLDTAASWRPSATLRTFLDGGEPPVYIGFGSMAGSDPRQLADVVLEALARCGQRAVLATGWGGLQSAEVPANVCVLDAAPHEWLFPRMAAVVHHGGAGTTAAGLRAGRPTVIVPFILDQPFWAARVRALGLGPEPIPRKGLTAARLAQAIEMAVVDPAIQRRALACGAAIRDEDGVGRAVAVVRSYVGDPQPNPA